MKRFSSSIMLLGLVGLVAPTMVHGRVFVKDDFIEETEIASLLGKFPTKLHHFQDDIDVSQTLHDRLVQYTAPASHGRENQAVTVPGKTVVPARREYGSFGEHKDRMPVTCEVVEGHLGLLYLKGDGRLKFIHDASGNVSFVDVKPGRFLSWPNHEYTHILHLGAKLREMIGPMTFLPASNSFVMTSASPTDDILFQAQASTLLPAPGSILTITADMVIFKWDMSTKRLDNNFVVGCSLGAASQFGFSEDFRLLTAKYEDEGEGFFKGSTLVPNTWKPKLRYDVIDNGKGITWTLTEDGAMLKKQYKIVWKVRIGRNVRSGEELDFHVTIPYAAVNRILTVVVK